MSVMATTHINTLPDDADEDAIVRAWNAAFKIVAEATFAGAADEELAAVA